MSFTEYILCQILSWAEKLKQVVLFTTKFNSEKWLLLSHRSVTKSFFCNIKFIDLFLAFWSWMSRPKLLQESNSTLVDPQILILAKLLAAWKQNTNVPTMAWLLPKNGENELRKVDHLFRKNCIYLPYLTK